MNGFFEHQYLSYKKNHLKNLLALANADGNMHPDEEKLLFKIGKRVGLKDRQIKNLLESEEKYIVAIPDNHNDKMNLLHDLLLMIYADGKVVKTELEFFEDTVIKFGLKKEMVAWLLQVFEENGIPPSSEDWAEIKKEAGLKFSLQ